MSCDLHRLVSGGRGGEIRLWRLGPAARRLARGLAAAAEDEEEADTGPGEAEACGEGRALFAHPRSSSVASVALDRFGLVSGDCTALYCTVLYCTVQVRAGVRGRPRAGDRLGLLGLAVPRLPLQALHPARARPAGALTQGEHT